jgi:hypothetical protein
MKLLFALATISLFTLTLAAPAVAETSEQCTARCKRVCTKSANFQCMDYCRKRQCR